MKRDELNYVLESNKYLTGGMKEARVKVRDFIKYVENPGNQLQAPLSCVSTDEFIEAVEILLAYTFKKEDEIPKRWRCDSDCRSINTEIFCTGVCNLDDESDKLCPFFMDESLI